MNIKSKISNLLDSRISKAIILIFGCAVLSYLLVSIYFLIEQGSPDPASIMWMLIAAVILFLFISIFIVSNRVSNFFFELANFVSLGKLTKKPAKARVSKLRKRIVLAFSASATLPAVIVAIFSIYFFNISVQSWFDSKVSKVLDQSLLVAQSYVSEHVVQLKETALSVADDLNNMYYDLIEDSERFSKVLNDQAEVRSIDEAIVFQRNMNTILAQTSLSFSLSFTSISANLIERANSGEIVRIPSDETKIRMLIKLSDFNDTYLLIGRLIDGQIINHISKTEGSVAEYQRLKQNINDMQIKFSLGFFAITTMLIITAVVWGRNFAERIVKPIRDLVKAAEEVKNGNLSASVPEKGLNKDEIRILSSAFNRMVRQINRQQKELLVAQRALAWSDVARQVAHEIKNPLTPIQLSANRLETKFADQVEDKEMFKKYINNILNKSNDIKNIVSEFVNFARMPAPIFKHCDISKLVSDLVDSKRLINESIDYKFYTYSSEIDFVCDLSQITQVMENLLQNAEDALESAIDGENKKPFIEVSINTNSRKDTIFITVVDNGSGFSNELLTSAKTPYVTTKVKGTGLGLAIVDRIAQDHFGSFEINNNEYGGASLKLSFDVRLLKEKVKT